MVTGCLCGRSKEAHGETGPGESFVAVPFLTHGPGQFLFTPPTLAGTSPVLEGHSRVPSGFPRLGKRATGKKTN